LLSNNKIKIERILLAGMGEADKITAEKIREFGGKLIRFLKSHKSKEVCLFSFGYGLKNIQIHEATQALAEGMILGDYSFDQYKTNKEQKQKPLGSIFLFPVNESETDELKKGLANAQTLAEVVVIARDAINEPANVMTPSNFANLAKKVAKSSKLRCKVLDIGTIRKEKMNCLLSVSQGSEEKPKLVILEYRTTKKNPHYALVGKGVTFDSGGLSLKPPKLQEDMKSDMSGATVVMAAMSAIAKLKLPINLTGILPMVENMPDGKASRPGDIVKSANGKTVEILNTDAEGRLILADALHYAVKMKPDAIIDIATLTSASMVALGTEVAAVLGTGQKIIKGLIDAGTTTHERVWELPLFEDYTEQIKSSVADLKNVGADSPYDGGVCTAAAFLKEFVEETPWAHIDIGGTAFTKKDVGYFSKGATGFGVRLLVKYFENIAKE